MNPSKPKPALTTFPIRNDIPRALLASEYKHLNSRLENRRAAALNYGKKRRDIHSQYDRQPNHTLRTNQSDLRGAMSIDGSQQ